MYIIGIFACIYLGYTFIQFSDYLGEFVNIFSKAETNDDKYDKTITLIKKVILLGIQQLVYQYIFLHLMIMSV